MSLIEGNHIGDDYGIYKHNEKKYDFGETNTGDITKNEKYYSQLINNNKYNLITFDCGVDMLQKKLLKKLFNSQYRIIKNINYTTTIIMKIYISKNKQFIKKIANLINNSI